MIVGTAGHIDHGKTSLVRRLTGRDTDRLPEEKRSFEATGLDFVAMLEMINLSSRAAVVQKRLQTILG